MKKLLIVVDYQNDFIDGSLGFDDAKKIEPKIIDWIEKFIANGDEVVFTLDAHEDDYKGSVEEKHIPIYHCIKGTHGFEVPDTLKKYMVDKKVFKKKTFGSLSLANYIYENKDMFSEIYLCGLVSSICVFSNAIMAKNSANINTPVKVIKEASAGFDKNIEEMAYKLLTHLHFDIV